MKAILKISDQVTIEVEAEKQTELFRGVAQALEAFSQTTCGLCQAPAIPGHRVAAGNEFHEMRCTNPECGARSLGQHKERTRCSRSAASPMTAGRTARRASPAST